jgi:hypothetical protein
MSHLISCLASSLSAPLMLTMLVLVALFVLVTEIAKKLFHSRVENQTAQLDHMLT